MDQFLKLLFGILLAAFLLMPTSAYFTHADDYGDTVYELAKDLSSGDEALMQEVQQLIANPARTPQEVGFYGGADYPERARIYLSVVTALDKGGFLYSTEDKNIVELFLRWLNEGMIGRENFPKNRTKLWIFHQRSALDRGTHRSRIGKVGDFL